MSSHRHVVDSVIGDAERGFGTTIWKLSYPFIEGTEQVRLGGGLTVMERGKDYDPHPEAGQIVFREAPARGLHLYVEYEVEIDASTHGP